MTGKELIMNRNFLPWAAGVVGLGVVGALGAVGFIHSGIYDYRAVSPHYPIVSWALHQTYQNSMEARTKDIAIPANLETPARVAAGARLYAANCAMCHGAPGEKLNPIGEGIYPSAPFLLKASRKNHPNQVFYVAKYGIKMTGMPAFGKSFSDEDLWALAAFAHKDRGISAADYLAMTATPAATPAAATPPAATTIPAASN